MADIPSIYKITIVLGKSDLEYIITACPENIELQRIFEVLIIPQDSIML